MMASTPLDPDGFYRLRTAVEELALSLRRESRRRLLLPAVSGPPPAPAESVSADDVLAGTLGAVASAGRRLGQAGAVLGLGSHPLTLQFAGELVGASPDGSRILLRVTAGEKA
jgi:hypothetical protein